MNAEQRKRDRERRQRETYAAVKTFSPELYNKVVAFASTVDLRDEGKARATIEAYCMSLVAEVHGSGA